MLDATAARAPAESLLEVAQAARAVARGGRLEPTLAVVLAAAVDAVRADVGVLWLSDGDGLVAAAVAAESGAVAAELDGLRAAAGTSTVDLLRRKLGFDDAAPALSLPLAGAAGAIGTLDLVRSGGAFDEEDEALAALAADLATLATDVCADGSRETREVVLDVGGDALAAVADAGHVATRVARVAATAAGADGALVWSGGRERVELRGVHGVHGGTPELEAAARAVVGDHRAAAVTTERGRTIVTLQLGEPPVGALQLVCAAEADPGDAELERLTTFAVRAAHALRAAERVEQLAHELDRSRALLEVVGETTSRLSLAHTLDTALERLATLFATDRVAVYLGDASELTVAAARALTGPHEVVAAALLEDALGPRRGREVLEIADVAAEPLLASVVEEARTAAIRAAIALPLLVDDVPIGLLALYPTRPRQLTAHESALLSALAAQLAVAVQNAQLHERATTSERELEAVLADERKAAKRLQTLYDISREFVQSLSLEGTLDALAKSIVTLLDVDAAVIRMLDERGLEFTARAVHVNDARVDGPARALLARPQPLPQTDLRRLVEAPEPLLLDAGSAQELGGSLALLAPFLEKGSSAAVVPIVSSGELLATLTIVSLHPGRPVAGDVVETAQSITGQAALAIDNARLYAQQKEFADTMQRSLLPRSAPVLHGLELGDVYESSARVDVGGDVYDYLTLDDGRLAVVLGDVTGHGVDAAADMAMAKFVFRSLAREHTDPGAFLAAANEVV
ncbi:MAG TPA: GAF domain-containing protein, partial [Gaiellaceae bacterium]|nr:GAF domain-containing protein [Gaiellaceae bacterium]